MTREQEIVDAVETLLDVAVSHHHDEKSGDTFENCHACGLFEDHQEHCFVPKLKEWMNTPAVERAK